MKLLKKMKIKVKTIMIKKVSITQTTVQKNQSLLMKTIQIKFKKP